MAGGCFVLHQVEWILFTMGVIQWAGGWGCFEWGIVRARHGEGYGQISSENMGQFVWIIGEQTSHLQL